MTQRRGNVWFLRVYRGVKHSFPMRWLEWVMAGFIIVWGYTFLSVTVDPNPAVAARSAWHGMTFWLPIWAWGTAMIAAGTLRLVALAINGTFRDTIYSQYSPLVRGITAGFCGLVWLAVALSSLSAGTQSGITYPCIFIIESFVSYFVLGEAGDNLRAHRNGRKH